MATATPPPPSLNPPPRHHQLRRRSFLLLPFTSSLLHPLSSSSAPPPSPPITDRVYMDFSLCPSYLRPDRPLGASSELPLCPDAEPLGRVVFGLYGRSVPITVSNFRAICASASYRGSLVHKLLPGQFFVAGKQGLRRDKGEVRPPPGLVRNVETVNPKAFELKHLQPGTLSLCLGQNDDEDDIKLDPEYHNMEFLVTTGPGPCPQLDNENIVFGTVLEAEGNKQFTNKNSLFTVPGFWWNKEQGTRAELLVRPVRGMCGSPRMDVITAIASFPTYRPAERIRQFNDFAVFIGDERAQVARSTWDRPLKTVYISDCGELKVTKPELTPSLP